jgi:hypothetical protein
MKKALPVHPFLFALFPALFIFTHNIGSIPLRQIYLPLFLILACVSVLFFFTERLVKDIYKTALLLSVFLIIFFSYGHIFNFAIAVAGKKYASSGPLLHRALLILSLLTFCIYAYLVIRTKKRLHNINEILNLVAIFLVTVQVVKAATITGLLKKAPPQSDTELNLVIKPEGRPDIYYIVLDGYARQDVLKDFYGYDNKELSDYLIKKDFYVADKSASNYSQTCLSLASSLNMEYLDRLAKGFGSDCQNMLPLLERIKKSRVFAIFKRLGYKIIAFRSGYELMEVDNADLIVSCGWQLNQFQNELLNTTPIPYFFIAFGGDAFQYRLHRENIIHAFDYLSRMPESKSPVFVLAYIMCPHPPFVLGTDTLSMGQNRKFSFADGPEWIRQEGTRQDFIEQYIAQLVSVNNKLKKAISNIFSRRQRKSVIVLQADHGPRSMLDFQSAEGTNLNETLAILNAYYFPDKDYSGLYRGISPVNTFRLLLNRYFDAKYGLLEDRHYFSTSAYPYRFIDVTEKLSK